jgi:hypothetical protein
MVESIVDSVPTPRGTAMTTIANATEPAMVVAKSASRRESGGGLVSVS